MVCPLCGRLHRPVTLRRGERALCVNCGSTLAAGKPGEDAALSMALTAMILAIPSLQQPIVVVRKFGVDHPSFLWTGIRALWLDGMHLLSIWVALCGIVVPLLLLATITTVVAPARFGWSVRPSRFWIGLAQAMQRWAMPEVQVLAVLVAFVKIGALVHVEPGAGLWFYGATAVAILLAWRTADLPEPEDAT